jgi:hypothetical protein
MLQEGDFSLANGMANGGRLDERRIFHIDGRKFPLMAMMVLFI